MWDLEIGERKRNDNSACKMRGLYGELGISESPYSYWISNSAIGFGSGLRINKDTRQGAKLEKMLTTNKSPHAVTLYLTEVYLKHVSVADFRAAISTVDSDAYQRGHTACADAIKRVLHL